MNQPVNKELAEGEYPAMVVLTEEKYRNLLKAEYNRGYKEGIEHATKSN